MEKEDIAKLAEALLKIGKASANVLKVHRKSEKIDEAISLLRQANGEAVGVLRELKSELKKYDIELD